MAQYAIVDTAHRPRFNERLEKMGVPYVSLFEGTAESSLLDVAPLIFKYEKQSASERLNSELEGFGAIRPAVSFVDAQAELEDVAKHFRQFHLVKVPELGGKDMLLRWYDTRILEAWMAVLTPEQRAAFAGCVDEWRYFDRFGELKTLLLPEPLQSGLPAITPFRLDQDQYAALLNDCEPDVVIAQLRRIIPDEMRKLPRDVAYKFVKKHVKKANSYAIENTDDVVQYLLLALYTSGGFIKHPLVNSFLHCMDGGRPDVRFSDWVVGVPVDIWELGVPLWDVTEGSEAGATIGGSHGGGPVGERCSEGRGNKHIR